MNETMKSQGELLKLLGDHLNLKVPDPNIDPTKEESPPPKCHAHMF
jgi:hypothetical protein